ncbi:MAG: NUDIX hydrolase [Myxococcales bacterium]|nr:NUDIX hydrolase [Myxococcales bacterium]
MPKDYTYCPQCSKALIQAERGGRQRAICPDETCGFVHWNNPTPVVAAIVEHEEGIILVRNQGWPASWFGLVSGFLEADETPEEGILREIKEELAIDAQLVSFIGAYAFSMRNELILAYHVKAQGEITLSEEIAAYKAVPAQKLRPWPFGTGEAVRDWLTQQGFSHHLAE